MARYIKKKTDFMETKSQCRKITKY